MDMDVTPRQLTFLKALGDLVLAQQVAVHYTQVAERMGVNRYSAYDMLKVLEAKGLAATDYVLSSGKASPGRSRIVFYPTSRGVELLNQHRATISKSADDNYWSGQASHSASEEWTDFKEAILRRLREAREIDARELLYELLSRLPERRHPLHYCAQMVTALVLNLDCLPDRMAAISPFDALEALTADGDEEMSALAGLSLGSALAANERIDHGVVEQLYAHMQRFQHHLHGLSSDSKRRLSLFLHEAVNIFEAPAASPAVGCQEQG